MLLRVLRTAVVVACAWSLAACSGGSSQPTADDRAADPQGVVAPDPSTSGDPEPDSADKAPMRIAGAVGSLSLTDAAVSITDANGLLLTSTTSDALARFSVEAQPNAALPLQLVASGGLDLLYDSPTPFVQAAIIETPGTQVINVSPLSTMITAVIECSSVPLSASEAWNLMTPQFAMGLPASDNPLTTETSELSAPALMLANALLEETIRRAETALGRADYPSSGNGILNALACDLSDDGVLNGTPDFERQLAAARAAEAAVLLELVADRLTFDGQLAGPRLDAALATLLGRSDLTASGVSENAAVIAQARRAALLFANSVESAEARVAIAALGGSPQQVAADFQALDYEPIRDELNALLYRMAGADTPALTALAEKMRAQAASPPPISSFAASASIVAPGEAVQLTWATSGAEACVAEGGWAGNRSLQGTFTTGPLQSSTRYALTCLGLGGVTGRTVDVEVAETPTQPPVGVSLAAAQTIVDAGDRARLTWAASNADSCTASGSWRGDRPTTGSEETEPLAEPATYTLVCLGPGGEDSASVTVGVAASPSPPPTLALSASAPTVAVGGLVELSWSSSGADGCWASGGWSGALGASGMKSVGPLTASNRYELTCTGPGGSASDSVTVSVDAPDAPSVALSVDERNVSSGDSVTLTWATTNALSCEAEGNWSGSRPGSGVETTGPLYEPQTFGLVCAGPGGAATSSVSINLHPELELTTTAAAVIAGETVTLSWSSDFADRCVASGGWSGSQPVAGSEVLTINADVSFSLSCTGPGGASSRTVSITADNPPEPMVSLSVADPSVSPGDSTTLYWVSSDATDCQASGNWSGSRSPDGSASTGPLAEPGVFTLVCSGPGGSASSSVDVEMLPEINVSLSADRVFAGDYVQVTWSSTDTDSCSASGDWSGARATSGSEEVGPLQADTTLSLSCSGPGGSATTVSRVDVSVPRAPAISFTSVDARLLQGGSTTLTWDADNADSCSADGGWSGARGTSGSQSTGPLDGTTTFTLTCTGPGGTDSATLAVAVDALPEPTLTLTADDEWVDAGNSTRLRWSAEHADSCEATGAWSGSRTVSGSEEIGPLTSSSTFSLSCSNAAGNAISIVTVDVSAQLTLSWVAPTENVDGSTLDDLSHYRVYYGAASRDYTEQVDVSDPDATSVSITVTPGSYFVAMTAIDAAGNESALSNEVEKEAR